MKKYSLWLSIQEFNEDTGTFDDIPCCLTFGSSYKHDSLHEIVKLATKIHNSMQTLA